MQLLTDYDKKSLKSNLTDMKMRERSARQRLKVREINEILACAICQGYMINPTSVDNCFHSFCRSCIVKHLLSSSYCPQCKFNGIKQLHQINISHLKPDDALRALIFKLVPGLYQQERDRIAQYVSSTRNGHLKLTDSLESLKDDTEGTDDNFFSPTEPISLSLEYHPALLKNCTDFSQIPPVRYLQCPAGVKIHHLKRFLCSKYDIDPDNRQIDVEVIYEDEVLPNDFTLMDVGYSYSWKRHAPMKFTYRILLHGSGEAQNHKNDHCNLKQSYKTASCNGNSTALPKRNSLPHSSKSVTFLDAEHNLTSCTYTSATTTTPASIKSALKSKAHSSGDGRAGGCGDGHLQTTLLEQASGNAPVKVVIARKGSEVGAVTKKQSPKRAQLSEETAAAAAAATTTATPANIVSSDFKSLRSNDIRYSDYAVTSTTSFVTPHLQGSAKRSAAVGALAVPVTVPVPDIHKLSTATTQMLTAGGRNGSNMTLKPLVPKCDIVVTIPHSQVQKSSCAAEELYEKVSLAQLKTASKKSTLNVATAANSFAAEEKQSKTIAKNVPKLKIELNSLKTTLSISKPKSADVHLSGKSSKKLKYRKHSLDDARPTTDKVDLATYAKSIGLKPIEVLTPAVDSLDAFEKFKYSPNASPMSSCSSTTSSSNSNFALAPSSSAEVPTSSTHKKRKKKHSKEPKDSSKRRKLHAEISSQAAKEPLKMKVKITPTPNHKAHKAAECKKSPTANAAESILKAPQLLAVDEAKDRNSLDTASLSVLNRTLCEESQSINNLMKQNTGAATTAKRRPTLDNALVLETEGGESKNSVNKSNLQPKPVAQIRKDVKVPSSPPLPPSLFKAVPLTFPSLTAPPAPFNLKPPSVETSKAESRRDVVTAASTLLQAPKISATSLTPLKTQPFAVPNPPRPLGSVHKFLSTPASIASALNKQVQLKRSVSLDESLSKKQKLEQQDRLARRTAYGPFLGYAHTMSNPVVKLSTGLKEDKSKSLYVPQVTAAAAAHHKTLSPTLLPASTLSICKRNDPLYSATAAPSSTGGITMAVRPRPTMTQAQQGVAYNKAALEIVKLTPMDLVRPISPPKSVSRLMGPPAGLPSKVKHAAPLSLTYKAGAPGQNSTFRSSPPALINLRSPSFPTAGKFAGSAAGAYAAGAKKLEKLNEEKPKVSLREFRPPTKEGNIDILDLSSPTSTTAPVTAAAPTSVEAGGSKTQKSAASDDSSPSSTAAAASSPSSSVNLEAALNKIKQNMTSSTVGDNAAPTAPLSKVNSVGSADSNTDDLQNLHLLSESATAREKIAIKAQIYEKPLKLAQPPLVRQQNASVRNIPNPSALAFRNQPSTTTSTTTPTTTTATSTAVSTAAVAAAEQKCTTAAELAGNTGGTNNSPPRATKKLTTIDQVAANLNIRAAAAEASAAKASAAATVTTNTSVTTSPAEEPALVSSTSVTENNNNNINSNNNNSNKNNNNNNNNNSSTQSNKNNFTVEKLVARVEADKSSKTAVTAAATTTTTKTTTAAAVAAQAITTTTTTASLLKSSANTRKIDSSSTTPTICNSNGNTGSSSGSSTNTNNSISSSSNNRNNNNNNNSSSNNNNVSCVGGATSTTTTTTTTATSGSTSSILKPPAISIISSLASTVASEVTATKLASAV